MTRRRARIASAFLATAVMAGLGFQAATVARSSSPPRVSVSSSSPLSTPPAIVENHDYMVLTASGTGIDLWDKSEEKVLRVPAPACPVVFPPHKTLHLQRSRPSPLADWTVSLAPLCPR